jgi:plastocyanin
MRLALFAAVLAAAAAACDGDPAGPSVSYTSVAVADYTFGPDTVTIAAGRGVRWTNAGPSAHIVSADGGSFTGTLGAPGMDAYGYPTGGGSYSKVFTTAGSYAYHCSLHVQMTGVVIVTP